MIDSIDKYWQLVDDLQKEVVRVSELYHDAIRCVPGCCDCCETFSVFPIEAEIIRSALGKIDNQSLGLTKGGAGSCSLLNDNRCPIYSHRPLICRTQGLPLGYIDHEREVVEVSACELNFTGHEQFDVDQLLMMDHFNARLQEINEEFSKKTKIDPWQRISISDIFLHKISA